MSRILNDLMPEGIGVEPEAVTTLSLFLTHHVNCFSRYSLDLGRNPPDIDYKRLPNPEGLEGALAG